MITINFNQSQLFKTIRPVESLDSIQFAIVYYSKSLTFSTESKYFLIFVERDRRDRESVCYKYYRRVMSDTEQKTEGEQQVETPELSRILPLGM